MGGKKREMKAAHRAGAPPTPSWLNPTHLFRHHPIASRPIHAHPPHLPPQLAHFPSPPEHHQSKAQTSTNTTTLRPLSLTLGLPRTNSNSPKSSKLPLPSHHTLWPLFLSLPFSFYLLFFLRFRISPTTPLIPCNLLQNHLRPCAVDRYSRTQSKHVWRFAKAPSGQSGMSSLCRLMLFSFIVFSPHRHVCSSPPPRAFAPMRLALPSCLESVVHN